MRLNGLGIEAELAVQLWIAAQYLGSTEWIKEIVRLEAAKGWMGRRRPDRGFEIGLKRGSAPTAS
ncbi:hypothetical protein EDD85DRAFT_961654 [Armillaria nabsnona]|nr:hypothetical protein EDD85DRAFT_961654 [Armillaria nabsnona]